ncbi:MULTISPECIES: hypothetical protein [Caballeronia]|uniref:Uncharacterized protein n=1 Tax=Caballeronia zhejiangensis TaxID=871203 RepID=A0A656QJ90_9BURK|nr:MULTISPECIES: hypothetical protein [Caballeronia]KDR28529.1 hypothetical protein BG60_11165 [Caballeronia zhejiangensis]MCE4547857.1 hypothetical protein [Caballeronia sp. PC1]MCE4575589.1 hypothetical protein [Caballeronia sp. CLC5]
MQTELDLAPASIAHSAIDSARRTSAATARVERVFAAMSRIIDAADSRLQHYRQDFYKYDRAYLERTSASGTYGWIVRDTGTHLVQLGRHPKMHEELAAALNITDNLDCYLVDARLATVTQVDVARMRERMGQMQYTVTNGAVMRGEIRIASIDVQMTPWSHGESPKGIVCLESAGSTLNADDLIALVQIAECEVVRKSQSLFTGTRSVTLDGKDLHELIAQSAG